MLKRWIKTAARKAAKRIAGDIEIARIWQATQDSARFVNESMGQGARAFPKRNDLLAASLAAVDPELREALYCEFGVYRGESINFMAARTPFAVHGFDSFTGLPEPWNDLPRETFTLSSVLPRVRRNVVLHKGLFADTLPDFLRAHEGAIGFLHMDADLYNSTKCVFDLAGDRIVKGTVIQFDEYFNYPDWRNGEYRAFAEFCEATGTDFTYIGYVRDACQSAVRITGRSARPC